MSDLPPDPREQDSPSNEIKKARLDAEVKLAKIDNVDYQFWVVIRTGVVAVAACVVTGLIGLTIYHVQTDARQYEACVAATQDADQC